MPPRPGFEVFLYFEDEVRWGDGMVYLSNETHIMAAIPTARNDSFLQVLPYSERSRFFSAVKIRFPPTAILRASLRYLVTLSAGALEDLAGNVTGEIRLRFHCLMVASDVAPHQTVPGSRHIFRFWYDEDIIKTTDQKPPVQLEFPTGEVVEVPGESQNVTIDRNILTVVFPEHVIGRGGLVTLRVPRYIFVDVLRRTNNVVEGGGTPAPLEEEITFMVQPEETERPRLNVSHCYPPMEETPSYEFPATGRIILAFSEEVKGGPGDVTFYPRSVGSPKVTVPFRDG